MTHGVSPIQAALDQASWLTTTMPIRLFGDSVLTSLCEPVSAEEFASGQAKKWADQLDDFMITYRAHTGLGRGLAANQIGLTKQVIWVWNGQKSLIFFNPHITAQHGQAEYPESCISSAALVIGDVRRPWAIDLQYQNELGQHTHAHYDDLIARILQHEIDHLAGRICSDQYLPGTIRIVTGDKTAIATPKIKRISP